MRRAGSTAAIFAIRMRHGIISPAALRSLTSMSLVQRLMLVLVIIAIQTRP
jgi:hypothetical protein